MKILVVGLSDSIHLARWLNQITDQQWQIYLFSSRDYFLKHESIENVIFCNPFTFVRYKKLFSFLYRLYRYILIGIDPLYLEKRLKRYINKIKPDIIHTIETQSAGYLMHSVKNNYYQDKKFPIWWHTNWGSDIYLYGRLNDHKAKIADVLGECDFYSCECQRDVKLAREFGFKGEVMSIYPNTGGFVIDSLKDATSFCNLPSCRKNIMLKGYQGWAGRALVGLRALARAKDVLQGYTLIIYSNTDSIDIKIAAELFAQETDITVKMIPKNTNHEIILALHGSARISIGLSISDGISTSLLEAMAMGSFPIQSWTSAADEWIKDGENGLLVPPEDPDIVEIAIRRALLDDQLVNDAAQKNWQLISERVDYNKLKDMTLNSYKTVYKHNIKQ